MVRGRRAPGRARRAVYPWLRCDASSGRRWSGPFCWAWGSRPGRRRRGLRTPRSIQRHQRAPGSSAWALGAPRPGPLSTGVGGQLSGRALLQLGRISGDFGVREGLYTQDARSAGTLFSGRAGPRTRPIRVPASPTTTRCPGPSCWSTRWGRPQGPHPVSDTAQGSSWAGDGGRRWTASGSRAAWAWGSRPRRPGCPIAWRAPTLWLLDLLLMVDLGRRLAE